MLHTCSTFQHKAGETGREWNGERQMHVATVTDEALQTKMKHDKRRYSICFTQKKDSTLIHLINPDKLYFVFKFGVSRYLITRYTRSTAYCKSHVLYCTSATCPSVSCFLPNDSWAGLPLQTWTAYVVKTMDVWINVHKLQKGKYPSRIKKALKIKYNTFFKNYHRKPSKIKC